MLKQATFPLLLFFTILAASCAPTYPAPLAAAPTLIPVKTATITPAVSPTLTLTPTLTYTPTLQPRLASARYGPELEDFPPAINPLSGQAQANPSMLELPAVLVSISNSPVSARPQAGPGFAPWVFELFIGTGTTRFMGVFYGDLPRRIPNVSGGCDAAPQPVDFSKPWVGNRVWLDENANGQSDPWEAGVGQVCVSLVDGVSGEDVAVTATDDNGYFGLASTSLSAGASPSLGAGPGYKLRFKLPAAYQFVKQDTGNEDQDSDADPQTGETALFQVSETDMGWDAGLILANPPAPTASPTPGGTPPADIAPNRTYVGPVRSGRLTYEDFYQMFPFSCLVFAGAGNGILEQLDLCERVFGTSDTSPNTALLDTSRMLELAQKNKKPGQVVNYSGHLFDDTPPMDGQPASSVLSFYHSYAQARWTYNPLSGAYQRETDDADGLGLFHPHLERLTGRQLAFENVIFILADYKVFRRLQYDIDFSIGLEGYASLFRDGQRYPIRWSTVNGAWEKKTGLLRPIHFIGEDKKPFPLKPGRTWISILTLNSVVEDLGAGAWRAYFVPPNDPPED